MRENLRQEIQRCMTELTEMEDGSLRGRFVFPPDFTGFQGHFPGQPILPGVCKVQAVLVMLEQWQGRKVDLKEIVLAKFFTPVLPEEEVFIKCSPLAGKDGHSLIRASVALGEKRVAALTLKVSFEREISR